MTTMSIIVKLYMCREGLLISWFIYVYVMEVFITLNQKA